MGPLLRNVRGQVVALAIRNPRLLAVALLLLDGWCDSLLLLAPDIAPRLCGEFMRIVSATRVLTDADVTVVDRDSEVVRDAWARDLPGLATRYYLSTSGTSGDARLISHSFDSLTRTLKRDAMRGAALRWGLMYDLNRFAGLQVFLQSLLGGSTLVVDDAIESPLEDRLRVFGKLGVNALSATPTHWRRILMSGAATALDLRIVSMGGEIATQAVINALSARWPAARITHIYASTEAGVGFAVSDRIEGFPVSWLQDTARGIAVDVFSGELMLCTPASIKDAATWSKTGDAVEVGEDRVRFLGRINGSINVGGNKFMPEEVERVILAYPGVAAASVKARKSAITGALVVADVVMTGTGGDDGRLRSELTAHCRDRLAPYKVPALLNFVDHIESGRNGKALRN